MTRAQEFLTSADQLGATKRNVKAAADQQRPSISRAEKEKVNPERSIQVVNTEIPLRASPENSFVVSSKPVDDDFKTFVTSTLLMLKAKVEKNELEMEQFRRVTVENAPNNVILKKVEEQNREIAALKETIKRSEAALNKKLFDRASAADDQHEKLAREVNRKLDSLHRQGESIERQNVNIASHLNLPDPRKDAQALREEERRREIRDRSYSRPSSRPDPSTRKRSIDWFNCSSRPEQGQGSRREERPSKKRSLAGVLDAEFDLSNPPNE